MPLATVRTRAADGLRAEAVTVEVQLAGGEFRTSIVGLTETAVKEAGFRVRAALRQAGFTLPTGHVIVHLAPADLKKSGGRFDLPIALGILAATGQLPATALAGAEFIGELGLDGEVRPVHGVLPTARAAREAGKTLYVPAANGVEAALVAGLKVHVVRNLLELCAHLLGRAELVAVNPPKARGTTDAEDLAEVRGQSHARRALEVAAAGRHNLLMVGPPGTGKSMLAARLPSILPPLTDREALDVATIASITGAHDPAEAWGRRPFRQPHHSASHVALVGGGGSPRPGEITRAHHGVLFLDELPEFPRRTLEALREPLEAGHIVVSRAARQVEFPARFLLVAAMNPCPCGNLADPNGRCNCTAEQVERYRARVSGPLLDRIDLHVEVPRVSRAELHSAPTGESSARVRKRTTAALERQLARQGCANSELSGRAAELRAGLDSTGERLLADAVDRLGLSARAYHRVLKVARSIADLAGTTTVASEHVAEAISYRRLDRR